MALATGPVLFLFGRRRGDPPTDFRREAPQAHRLERTENADRPPTSRRKRAALEGGGSPRSRTPTAAALHTHKRAASNNSAGGKQKQGFGTPKPPNRLGGVDCEGWIIPEHLVADGPRHLCCFQVDEPLNAQPPPVRMNDDARQPMNASMKEDHGARGLRAATGTPMSVQQSTC